MVASEEPLDSMQGASNSPSPVPSTGGMGVTPGYPTRDRSASRLARLKARVALALLAGKGDGPVAEAVAYLRDVVAGRVGVAPRVQAAAAAALLKAGTAMASQSETDRGATVDARSVTVVVGELRPETLDAADRLLASLGSGVPGGVGVELDGRGVRPHPPAHPAPIETGGGGD